MKINEITNTLKTFVATVKVNGRSIKTSVTAESSTHARLLLQRLYGAGNVSSLSESLSELVAAAGTKVMDAGDLQVKSLADKAKQFTQQKKQLQARQDMSKAQEKMRDASKPLA
jgi:phage shock protein A